MALLEAQGVRVKAEHQQAISELNRELSIMTDKLALSEEAHVQARERLEIESAEHVQELDRLDSAIYDTTQSKRAAIEKLQEELRNALGGLKQAKCTLASERERYATQRSAGSSLP